MPWIVPGRVRRYCAECREFTESGVTGVPPEEYCLTCGPPDDDYFGGLAGDDWDDDDEVD